MGLSDALHSALVLGTSAAYALPLYEAIQRRSSFYTLTFAVILTLSFALHCEESGLCAPFETPFHDRLAVISQGMSYFLFGLMTLVAFEIRNDLVARAVVAMFAIGITGRDVYDLNFNIGGMLALGILLAVVDSALFSRQFTAAYWRRLGVIVAMALGGALIFRAVHSFWWHGVWHVYFAGSIHLLLLAQRTKRMLARGGGHASHGARGANVGYSSNVADSGLTTPLKRKGTVVGGGGAVAAVMPEQGNGAGGGAVTQGSEGGEDDTPLPSARSLLAMSSRPVQIV